MTSTPARIEAVVRAARRVASRSPSHIAMKELREALAALDAPPVELELARKDTAENVTKF